MEVLMINQQEVRQLLRMEECMHAMAEALQTLGRGDGINPLRPVLWLPEKVGALGMMPGYLDSIKRMGIKVVSVFPGNHGTEYDSHQGSVLLFETEHGRLVAMIDASEITAIRTAAVSGVATQLLANEAANDLAILGSGVQARTHLEAMQVARNLSLVRVWSPNAVHLENFIAAESSMYSFPIQAVRSAEEAVEGAEIICTVSSAREPILLGEWLQPGVHINAVGSSVPFTRELDTAAVLKSSLFVDRRESTLNEAGDFLFPKKEGVLDDDHIRAEIGDVLLGDAQGRGSDDEITLFKSLGLAVEDVAAAEVVYQAARAAGAGRSVELGGSRA